MSKTTSGQMQEFTLTMQKTMVEYVQNTMLKQLGFFEAIQKPMVGRLDEISTRVRNIMTEQADVLSSDLSKPLSDQARDFTRQVQSIMGEQMQLFMTTTQNPTREEVEEFVDGMQEVMLEQIKLATKMQDLMSQEMLQVLEDMRRSLSELSGPVKDQVE